MTRNGESALHAARMDLRTRCRITGEADEWVDEHRLLEALYDVADMVCRIGDHPESTRYRAEKAASLVSAALDVRCAALQNHAGRGEDERADLARVVCLEKELDEQIGRVMWVIARRHDGSGTRLCCSDATALLRALRRLVDWAEQMAATAVPDAIE